MTVQGAQAGPAHLAHYWLGERSLLTAGAERGGVECRRQLNQTRRVDSRRALIAFTAREKRSKDSIDLRGPFSALRNPVEMGLF